MKFKEYQSIILAENVTLDNFIKNVQNYSTLDDALANMEDDYIEWYLLNMNNKKLKQNLKKLKLYEDDVTLGYAPEPKKIKKNIKYKGQFITVEYDPELATWFPMIRFRSIVSALKYIKRTVDYNTENI